jgi:hypothetical protein
MIFQKRVIAFIMVVLRRVITGHEEMHVRYYYDEEMFRDFIMSTS